MRLPFRVAWAFLAAIIWVQAGRAQSDAQSEYQANLAKAKGRMASASALAQKVSAIANSGELSTAKKEKRISTVVRIAVVAATAYKDDPDVVLGIAIKMAQAAARAAPRFTETIANAVAFSPYVSRIEGAQHRIRTAAFAAARGPKKKRVRSEDYAVNRSPDENAEEGMRPESEAAAPPAQTEAPAESRVPATESSRKVSENVAAVEAPESTSDQMQGDGTPSEDNPNPTGRHRSATSKISEGENAKLTASATLGAQHDDNVYFSNSNKVSDTIYSIEPGLAFTFGQNSLDHGSLEYQENFLRYAKHTSPNVNLGSASGDFGYEDGGLKLSANGNYQQLFQNNIDVLTLGASALYRSNVYNLSGTGEVQIGANTSASAGIAYTHLAYALPTLLSYEDISFPVNGYYHLTPKLDISAGYTYGIFRPQGAGPDAKDGYANIGARGEFTEKLTGSVSVGYITRTFDTKSDASLPAAQYQSSHGLGFTGDLGYEITPKTSANLSFSRSFSASALAQTTTNSTYSLSLTTALSPQWNVGESLSEQIVDYGPQVFFLQNTLVEGNRKDSLLIANLHVSYIYSKWLSGTAAYFFRNDHSTISTIDFSDNIFSLSLNLSY
jgi:polysaccharide biosynthesis protein VpsM